MIPKIIHYCWFSGDRKPKNVRACIKSWKRMFPDYEIKCWDSNSFDFNSVPFVKEAYAHKKWAFVSDYIRLYALHTEGGIYLDSDVQAFGRIDDWHNYDLFTGIEKRGDTDDLFIEAAIIGASKGNVLIEKCLNLYKQRDFVSKDNKLDFTPIPTIVTPLFCEEVGWRRIDEKQELNGNAIVLSSSDIANTETPINNSIKLYHWNNRSWIPRTRKEKLYKLTGDIGLLPIWDWYKRSRGKYNLKAKQ